LEESEIFDSIDPTQYRKVEEKLKRVQELQRIDKLVHKYGKELEEIKEKKMQCEKKVDECLTKINNHYKSDRSLGEKMEEKHLKVQDLLQQKIKILETMFIN